MNQRGNEKMTSMTIRIDFDIKEKLEQLATLDRRSLSEYVRIVLEEHVSHKN